MPETTTETTETVTTSIEAGGEAPPVIVTDPAPSVDPVGDGVALTSIAHPVGNPVAAEAEPAAASIEPAPSERLTDEQIAKVVHEAVRAYAEVTGDTSIPSWGWNTPEDQYAQINAIDAARKGGVPDEKPEETSELIRVALTHLLLQA